MAATYRVYQFTAPSGAVVYVRRAAPVLLLAQETYVLPLLTAAMRLVSASRAEVAPPPAETQESNGLRSVVERICRACLVDPRCPEDIAFGDIPQTDALAIYQWALTEPGGEERAITERTWQLDDVRSIATGEGAILLDMVARRYRTRPSILLDVGDQPWAFDLDAAVAYRALAHENQAAREARHGDGGASGAPAGTGDDDLVTVPDMFGAMHTVPRRWLPEIPRDAKVIDADDLAADRGEMVMVAGSNPAGGWTMGRLH